MVTNTGDSVDPELGVVAAGENAFEDEYVPPWHKQITLKQPFTRQENIVIQTCVSLLLLALLLVVVQQVICWEWVHT